MKERAKQISLEIINRIRSNDAKYLKSLYYQERRSFIGWALKNHRLSEGEALEIYQNAFTIMYTNIKHEKVTAIESSVSTYLVGIGKNLIRKHFKGANFSLDTEQYHLSDDGFQEKQEQTHQQVMIHSWLNKLGDPCRRILILYYFRKYSMEAIAREMGYKNEGVAKKKKCLCLKSLRDQLKGQPSTQ